jgi:uncharacterized protein YeaO (DUF488 family)
MTLRVYTARITYAGPDGLDITAKGRHPLGKAFAPSWALLAPVLDKRSRGRLTEADWLGYVEAYTAEMRRSYREQRAAWDDVLGRDEVTGLCYCTGPWCHRHVWAGLLGRLGAEVMGER